MILTCGIAARAAITTVALYHCGEDGDIPTNSLRAAVGTDAAFFYNSGGFASNVNGACRAPRSTNYLQTAKMAWSPGFAYLDGQANNWGMAAWVRLPDRTLNGSTYNEDSLYIMSNGGWDSGYGIKYGDPTTCYWRDGQTTYSAKVATNLWSNWVHVAAVYNGNNNKQLYVNGELLATEAANASWNTTDVGGLFRSMNIGTENYNNYAGRFVHPAIDEILVFSFAPGAFDIRDIYPFVEWFNPGVTNVTISSADAYATLEARLDSNAVATLYWGMTDAGPAHAGWEGSNFLGTVPTGLVENAAISGLIGGKKYYYRFYATNSILGAEGWSAQAWFRTADSRGTVILAR